MNGEPFFGTWFYTKNTFGTSPFFGVTINVNIYCSNAHEKSYQNTPYTPPSMTGVHRWLLWLWVISNKPTDSVLFGHPLFTALRSDKGGHIGYLEELLKIFILKCLPYLKGRLVGKREQYYSSSKKRLPVRGRDESQIDYVRLHRSEVEVFPPYWGGTSKIRSVRGTGVTNQVSTRG